MKNDEKSAVSRESDKFMLRLPDGMRQRISEEAKANGRSMNAEIVARLEVSFGGVAEGVVDTLGTTFAEVLERATQTPQFARAVLKVREEALKIAPELVDVDMSKILLPETDPEKK